VHLLGAALAILSAATFALTNAIGRRGVITGTPAFYDGQQGVQRLAPNLFRAHELGSSQNNAGSGELGHVRPGAPSVAVQLKLI